jgi:histone deacetylase complex regulatory component SIN3
VAEERRTSAKDLLVDIQQVVGPEKMAEICKTIKSLERRSVSDLKERVGEILHGQPVLFDRFLDYLPKQYRA